jgi:hypothetical protein
MVADRAPSVVARRECCVAASAGAETGHGGYAVGRARQILRNFQLASAAATTRIPTDQATAPSAA